MDDILAVGRDSPTRCRCLAGLVAQDDGPRPSVARYVQNVKKDAYVTLSGTCTAAAAPCAMGAITRPAGLIGVAIIYDRVRPRATRSYKHAIDEGPATQPGYTVIVCRVWACYAAVVIDTATTACRVNQRCTSDRRYPTVAA